MILLAFVANIDVYIAANLHGLVRMIRCSSECGDYRIPGDLPWNGHEASNQAPYTIIPFVIHCDHPETLEIISTRAREPVHIYK